RALSNRLPRPGPPAAVLHLPTSRRLTAPSALVHHCPLTAEPCATLCETSPADQSTTHSPAAKPKNILAHARLADPVSAHFLLPIPIVPVQRRHSPPICSKTCRANPDSLTGSPLISIPQLPLW